MSDTEGKKQKGLTDQQRRFADFILQGKNQRDAYRLAGYKCTTDEATDASASRLLSNVKVEDYLEAKRTKIAAKVELTAEHFATRLERIAAAAERTAFSMVGETLDVSTKEATDIANTHSMNAAKLLGKIVDKASVTHVVTHEDRLDRVRGKINDRREQSTTAH